MRQAFALRVAAPLALAAASIVAPASGAIVTNVFTENFEDATLASQLTAVNAPPIVNGYSDLNGVDTLGGAQGYTMSIASYNSADGGAGPGGGGPSTSWIMETRIGPASDTGSDGMGAAPANLDNIMGFNGRYGLRWTTGSGGNWALFSRVAGGASDVNSIIPGGAANWPTAGSHAAIVFTDNGTTDTLAFYKDGVLKHSISGDFNRSNNTLAGFGLDINTGALNNRGFNGTLDAIAFSTFTGTFDPATDAFALPVPEPTSLALVGIAGIALAGRRRRRA